MAYQALYRKYRPKSFEDFIDQDSVKKIIVNSLKNDKISHAYLFSGPRGIGKTSMAKIFAKAVNCLNFKENSDICKKCENCLECDNKSVDIIEIDAASNNGVDQIRELKNRINIVPDKLKYKVYIVDEVHMLSNSAFNALLKTLEEPPSHVIFILATTEFYEVPETIISRCQCYSFKRISLDSLVKRLNYIAKEEQINIDDNVIKEIAEYSNGGLRDAIGMLDKLNSFTTGQITIDDFKAINGLISHTDIKEFYEAVFNKKYSKIIEIIDKINESGYDYKYFIERLMIYTKDIITNFYVDNKKSTYGIDENINFVFALNELLNKLKDSLNEMILVQVYILNFVGQNENKDKDIISKEDRIISREINISKKSVTDEQKKEEKTTKNGGIVVNSEIKRIRINNSLATANIELKGTMKLIWDKLEEYFLDEKYGKVSQLLADTNLMVVGKNNIILTTSSIGLIDNIYNNIHLIEEFLESISKNHVKIVVVTEEEFTKIKDKYVLDLKNKVSYQLEEEHGEFIIDENENSLINKAISVFGSENIEIE